MEALDPGVGLWSPKCASLKCKKWVNELHSQICAAGTLREVCPWHHQLKQKFSIPNPERVQPAILRKIRKVCWLAFWQLWFYFSKIICICSHCKPNQRLRNTFLLDEISFFKNHDFVTMLLSCRALALQTHLKLCFDPFLVFSFLGRLFGH